MPVTASKGGIALHNLPTRGIGLFGGNLLPSFGIGLSAAANLGLKRFVGFVNDVGRMMNP